MVEDSFALLQRLKSSAGWRVLRLLERSQRP